MLKAPQDLSLISILISQLFAPWGFYSFDVGVERVFFSFYLLATSIYLRMPYVLCPILYIIL